MNFIPDFFINLTNLVMFFLKTNAKLQFRIIFYKQILVIPAGYRGVKMTSLSLS